MHTPLPRGYDYCQTVSCGPVHVAESSAVVSGHTRDEARTTACGAIAYVPSDLQQVEAEGGRPMVQILGHKCAACAAAIRRVRELLKYRAAMEGRWERL